MQRAFVIATLLLAACVGEAPGPSGPAPAGELVTAWTDTEAGRPGTGLYLRNNTQREILVHSVSLDACLGIREECGLHELSQRLAPGETRRVMSVQRLAPDRSFDFEWSFDWEYVEGGGRDGS